MFWRTPRSIRDRGLPTHREVRSGFLEAAADWEETGLWAGCGPPQQRIGGPVTGHSALSCPSPLFWRPPPQSPPKSWGYSRWCLPTHHNLLGRALRSFPTKSFLLLSSPGVQTEAGPSLSTWDSQAGLGTLNTAHSLVLAACSALREWVEVGKVPAGHLRHSLPSKSGWEQACILPETTRCTGRWETHSSAFQGVVFCEPCAGVSDFGADQPPRR